MLTDLAALTPPLLVGTAFLIAVGAFLRHEIRRIKNPADDEEADLSAEVSRQVSADEVEENPADPLATSRPVDDREGNLNPDRRPRLLAES